MLSSASAARPQRPHPVIAVDEVALVVDSHRLLSSWWPQSRYVGVGGGGQEVGSHLRSTATVGLGLAIHAVLSPFLTQYFGLQGMLRAGDGKFLANVPPSHVECLAYRVRSTGFYSQSSMEIGGSVANAISHPNLVSG